MRNVTCALVLGVAAATAMPALAQKAFDEGPDVTGLRSRGVYTPRRAGRRTRRDGRRLRQRLLLLRRRQRPWHGGLGLTVLRKGAKSACDNGPLVLAVTTDRNNGRSVRVETAIAAHVPRNHTLVMFACGSSADAAIAKVEDKPELTRIVAAWKYTDGVLAPVGNLRKVRCTNEGYGV
ncbi:MAG: hypothetical protein U1F67_17115 [Rubrivivax sp.]